eukprot:1149294-Pelagomonas_calceolata.AAC.2
MSKIVAEGLQLKEAERVFVQMFLSPTFFFLSSSQLCDLYENDSIFDKFDCCINGSGDAICTGSYNNMFRVFGVNGVDLTLEASRDPMRKRLQTPSKVGYSAGQLV